MEFPRYRSHLLATLRRCTRAGAPVQLTLMAFPFKVPNPAKVGSRTLPDLAELTAIRWCQALGARIAEIHSPGLRLEIIHDGALIAEVFGVALAEVRARSTSAAWSRPPAPSVRSAAMTSTCCSGGPGSTRHRRSGFAEATRRVLTDADRAASMRRLRRERAQRLFDIEPLARRTEQVFAECIRAG